MVLLEKHIRHLGATTAFTDAQVAEGAVEMAKLGFSANELQHSLAPALHLVRATGIETHRLGEISSYATNILRVFGLQAEQFSHVCDLMTYASNRSSANVVNLAESLKLAGPAAYNLGESLEDTTALLMVMANVGIKGTLAGTSLRNIFNAIAVQAGKTKGMNAEDIEQAQKDLSELQKLGVDVFDQKTGKLRPTIDIIMDLSNQLAKLEKAKKLNLVTDIFGLRGSAGALAAISKTQDLRKFQTEMLNVQGIAQETAERMESGIGGTFRRIFSMLYELAISIGEAVYAAFGEYLSKLPDAIAKIVEFVQENQKLIAIIVAITGAIVTAGGAFFALGIMVKVLAFAFGGLLTMVQAPYWLIVKFVGVIKFFVGVLATVKALLLAMTTPIGLIVAGVTIVLALTGHLGDAITLCAETARDSALIFGSAFADIKSTFSEAYGIIVDSLRSGDIEGAASLAFATYEKIATTSINAVGDEWDIVWHDSAVGFQAAWDEILTYFGYVNATIINIGVGLVNGIIGLFRNVLFYGVWGSIELIFAFLTDFFEVTGRAILATFTIIVASITKIANKVQSVLFDVLGFIIESLLIKAAEIRLEIDPTYTKKDFENFVKKAQGWVKAGKYAKQVTFDRNDEIMRSWAEDSVNSVKEAWQKERTSMVAKKMWAGITDGNEDQFWLKWASYTDLTKDMNAAKKARFDKHQEDTRKRKEERTKKQDEANAKYNQAKEEAMARKKAFDEARSIRNAFQSAPADYLKNVFANDAKAQGVMMGFQLLMASDPVKALTNLKTELDKERTKARDFRLAFDEALNKAMADSILTDKEKAKLAQITKDYGKAAALAQEYQKLIGEAQVKIDAERKDKLGEIPPATEESVKQTRAVSAIGSWSVEAISRMVKPETRAARAAEAVEKTTNKFYREAKKFFNKKEEKQETVYA
jgi:TP901 family phage tail tape measure protein